MLLVVVMMMMMLIVLVMMRLLDVHFLRCLLVHRMNRLELGMLWNELQHAMVSLHVLMIRIIIVYQIVHVQLAVAVDATIARMMRGHDIRVQNRRRWGWCSRRLLFLIHLITHSLFLDCKARISSATLLATDLLTSGGFAAAAAAAGSGGHGWRQ